MNRKAYITNLLEKGLIQKILVGRVDKGGMAPYKENLCKLFCSAIVGSAHVPASPERAYFTKNISFFDKTFFSKKVLAIAITAILAISVFVGVLLFETYYNASVITPFFIYLQFYILFYEYRRRVFGCSGAVQRSDG